MEDTPGWSLLSNLVDMAIKYPEGSPDRVSILELTDEQYRRLLTPRRLEILSILGSEKVDSVSHLAALCGRSLAAVSRDLRLLSRRSLVDMHVEGRTRRPERVNNIIMLSLPSKVAAGAEVGEGAASVVRESGGAWPEASSGRSNRSDREVPESPQDPGSTLGAGVRHPELDSLTPASSWFESGAPEEQNAAVDSVARALSEWFVGMVVLHDESYFGIASTKDHRGAIVLSVLTRSAKELIETPVDRKGRSYAPLCRMLAAACRRLGVEPGPRHWGQAIHGVAKQALPRGIPEAERFGLGQESLVMLFKGLMDECLVNAGVTHRPTILDRVNRRTSLGLAINWGLRFLLSYSLHATGARSRAGEDRRDLAWIRSKVQPLVDSFQIED